MNATNAAAPPAAAPVPPDVLLAVALDYAARGWHVVPMYPPADSRCTCMKGAECEHPGKHPRTTNGFNAASTDPATIEAWWRCWPDSNLGIMMSASGLLAVDMDVRHRGDRTLADLEAVHGPLPRTVQSLTGGGGKHFLFKHPGGDVSGGSNKLGLGLDVIVKGCIVVPPSLHGSGQQYVWEPDSDPGEAPVGPCPPWLLALIRPAPRKLAPALAARPVDGKSNRHLTAYVEKALKDEIAAVQSAPAGARNDTLNRAAFNLGQFVGGGYLDRATAEHELTAAATAAGLGEREIATTLRSGLDKGIAQPRTLEMDERERRAMGKTCPPDPEEVTAIVRCAADIVSRPVSWAWQDRLPADKLGLLIGHPGKGKTLLSTYMGAHFSNGQPWPDGAPCEICNVMYLTGEDDPDDTLVPWLRAAGADLGRISFLDGIGWRDPRTKEIQVSLVELDQHMSLLRKAIVNGQIKVLFIDPISSFVGHVDDCRNGPLRGLLSALASVARDTGCTIVCISHLRKAGGLAVHQAVGSLAYCAAARAVWALVLDPQDGERRLLLPVKCNLCKTPTGLAFRPVSDPAGNPILKWEDGAVKLQADDVLNPARHPGPAPVKEEEAGEWLVAALTAGPRNAQELIDEAEAVGITEGTLRRGKDDRGVEHYKDGFQGPWFWRLPQAGAQRWA